jgi:hypothetical protein
MFLIGHLTTILLPFFRHLKPFFERRQFPHFWRLVLAIALSEGRKTVAGLHRLLLNAPYQQRLVHFISVSPWDPEPVLQRAALYVLRALGWRPGMGVWVLIDGSKTRKRGKTMEASHRFFDHVTNAMTFGHQFLVVCLKFRGIVIPWSIRLYRTESYCRKKWKRKWQQHFRTQNQMAAEAINALPDELTGKYVCALFDSAFLCQVVVEACRKQDIIYESVAKSNRTFIPDHGKGKGGGKAKKRAVGAYGPGVVRYEGREIELPGYRGAQKFRVAERVGLLSKVGRVKLVFSQRVRDGAFIVLVTNDLALSAKDVVAGYRERWGIECWFKNSKQHLGLGDYQVIPEAGVEHHLHLCALAYLLLIHLGRSRSGEVNECKQENAAIGSVPELKAKLRDHLAADHLLRITRKFGRTPALQAVMDRMLLKKFG